MIEELVKVIELFKGINVGLAAIIVVGLGFTVVLVALSKQ